MKRSTRPKSATSYKDTSYGILSRSKTVELEEQGVKKGLELIINLSKEKAEITPDLIRKIHKESFGFIFPDWAGKFRIIEVVVGEYEPPHFSRIPELIKVLCDDFNERLKNLPSDEQEESYLASVVSLLAWFQNKFVWIHPFQDYNGRVARLLTNLILLNLGLPAIEIKADTENDRDKYIKAMKAADKHDYSNLENLLIQTLRDSLEEI